MVGWHDTEGYASLHPRLRATRFARAFDLSGRAAVIGGVGIQPERLNAEGEARVLLAGGGALAQPSECRMTQGKASERREKRLLFD